MKNINTLIKESQDPQIRSLLKELKALRKENKELKFKIKHPHAGGSGDSFERGDWNKWGNFNPKSLGSLPKLTN